MDYKIAFTPGAERDFKNIEKNKTVLKKIERAFDILRKNPKYTTVNVQLH
ncbi:MAG: hypothetical protein K8I03_02205 [Ignavibacteria bacterium]|nr:hypothetical protein [Ignavibacteria bacterium]